MALRLGCHSGRPYEEGDGEENGSASAQKKVDTFSEVLRGLVDWLIMQVFFLPSVSMFVLLFYHPHTLQELVKAEYSMQVVTAMHCHIKSWSHRAEEKRHHERHLVLNFQSLMVFLFIMHRSLHVGCSACLVT